MAALGPARVSWPGVRAVQSFVYTCSHGASPGTAVLTTVPRGAAEPPPAVFGDLLWGDGRRVVRLRDCRLDSLSPRVDSAGYSWALSVFDRRWRWRTPDANFGRISGSYNQRDNSGKLVPWTIRSPEELAKLCLKAMGEARYEIALPKGLTRADGLKYAERLRAGQNFPESFTNPPVVWNCTPPHEALSQLCDLFGCRLVYQPVTDKVVIAPLGVGPGLPAHPAVSVGQSLDLPEQPKLVGAEGASTLYQWRFVLEAVGKEWDGTYVPINDLSYAPEGAGAAGQKQVAKFRWGGSSVATGDVRVALTLNLFHSYSTAVSRDFTTDAAGSTVLTNAAAVVAVINGDPDASSMLVASIETNAGQPDTIVLTGRREGETWGSATVTDPAGGGDTWSVTQFDMPRVGGTAGGWEDCPVETFPTVRQTDRLSKAQAQEFARDSVFKCYRIRLVGVATGAGPFESPGYDKPVVRRHQIVITPYLNDLVVPEPRRAGSQLRADARPDNRGFGGLVRDGALPPYYNGVARAKEAKVYGAVSNEIGQKIWEAQDGDGNTDPETEVSVPFSVVEGEQMIKFADPVYARAKMAPGGYDRQRVPRLTLECAVVVKDAETDMPAVAEFSRDLGGAGGEEWLIFPDIQVTVTARYGPGNALSKTETDDADAKKRADYYLDSMVRKHRLDGADSRTYVGVYPIDPNGLIQQVSWSIGGGGFRTTASANSEHSRAVSPYPERRRAENLPPNGFAAAANLLEAFQLETSKGVPNLADVARRIRRGL